MGQRKACKGEVLPMAVYYQRQQAQTWGEAKIH